MLASVEKVELLKKTGILPLVILMTFRTMDCFSSRVNRVVSPAEPRMKSSDVP